MTTVATSKALRLEHLDLDRLPRAVRSRLLVAIMDDALGRPIRLPVLVAVGRRPGPVVGITAALHGNELNGIPVLHRLMAQIDVAQLRGTVVGVVVVNVPGLLREQRAFSDGVDLNHLMPGKADGKDSQLYAHRFIDRVVSRFDYLIDLHTASFGRVNSLYIRADLTNEVTARMGALLKPELLLHNPASDKTLRGTAMELGIPAVTVEIGNPQRFQKRYIKATVTGLRALLGDLELLPRRRLREGAEPIVCSSSAWQYTREGGFLEVFPELLERVEAGQRIAQLTDPFGDVTATYQAAHDGFVIGHSVNPVGQAGARIAHLGVPATGDEGFCVKV
jgi:predicted deacylase